MSGDLPKGWVETSIGSITAPYASIDPTKTPNKIFRYIDIGSIDNERLEIKGTKEFLGKDAPSRARRLISFGDTIFSTVRTYLRNIAFIQETHEGYLTSTGIAILRPVPGVVPQFLFRYVSSQPFVDAVSQGMDGTMYPAINDSDLDAHLIPLPPTAEQHRIVAKIDALFARSSRAREALAAIPALIDRYRQAVLAAAFRGDLTADWREAQRPAAPKIVARNPIDGRAKDLPALPDAWEWRAVGDLADISGGLTKNQKRHQLPRKMPYLRVANVYANELRLDEIAEIGVTPGEAEKLRLKSGDLLIVEGNGSLDQIGRVALWTDEVAGCGHQNHIIRARPLPNIVPKFVLYWLLSPLGRNAIQAVASSSSGLHTLSISKVSGLPIPFCSPDEMQAVVERIEVQLSALDKGGAEYYRASALIDRLDQSILDKAFSGRLVPQDPADEPAAQLLERIRAARAAAPNPKRGRRARG